MRWRQCFIAMGAVGAILGLAGPAVAVPVYWADWTSATYGASGTVEGTITLADSSTVGVTYSGEVYVPTQTSGGTFYWTPPATYQSATVDNAPMGSDVVSLRGGNDQVKTVTFSTPVANPVMTILSLGSSIDEAVYDFETPFSILSSGPGYFGNGPLTELAGEQLQGFEGYGTIQFPGTISSIVWTVPDGESWHGFTVGIPGVAGGPPTIPAPGAVVLGAFGAGMVGWLRRRRAL